MDCVTVIVKRVYIEVNPLGESLKGFYGETTMRRRENGVILLEKL